MKPETDQIIDATGNRWLDLREIWRYRELFYFFTWRDIKIKYKQTVLGFLWAILQPLFMMIIFTFFFGKTLKIPSQDMPYPVYVFSGLLIWNIFSVGLTNSANSMVNNALIIKKIYFPRLIIPVSSILVSLFDFLMAFSLLIVIFIYYQQPVSWIAAYCWPLALVIAALGTLGLGAWLAALNVKYRDFRYVIPFLVQVLFFLTPVLYPVSMLPYPILKYFMACSPMYAAIELFRFPISGIAPPGDLLMLSVASCFIFLIVGVLYFKFTEDFFADLA
jgi:lipopolysaccharide transport system permease protein